MNTATSAMNHGYCCLFLIAFSAVFREISLVELHSPLTL